MVFYTALSPIVSTSSRSCIFIGTRTTGSPDDRRPEPEKIEIIHAEFFTEDNLFME
jgi:hypothetical protein